MVVGGCGMLLDCGCGMLMACCETLVSERVDKAIFSGYRDKNNYFIGTIVHKLTTEDRLNSLELLRLMAV